VATPKVSLSVNDMPVPVEDFVQDFIRNVVIGMLTVLKGAEKMQSIELAIKGDIVVINVNNASVRANPFVNRFIKNTVLGMVSSLKGVSQIDRLEISITE